MAWDVGLDEKLWDSSKNVQIPTDKRVDLTGDRTVNSIKNIADKEIGGLNLNKHKLAIGSGGIIVGGKRGLGINNGILTSSVGQIRFEIISDLNHLGGISASITDNGNIKVGIDVVGPINGRGYRGIGFSGNVENTFSGDVNLFGGVRLDLYKSADVISLPGNLNVYDGAVAAVYRSGQIARKSKILLKSKSGTPSSVGFHSAYAKDIKIAFAKLTVDGKGVVNFSLNQVPNSNPHGTREIILDDLEVLAGSHLLVKEWLDGRDRLLVRKDSKHVRDSIKRIEFENHDTRTVNLRDYDKDYWEIYAIVPEPGTYGAILGALGLVIAQWRRLYRRPTAQQGMRSRLT